MTAPHPIFGDITSEEIDRQYHRNGSLIPLRTLGEVRAAHDTFDAHVIQVPARYADGLIKAVRSSIPNLNSIDIQHLRRVVKPEFVPELVIRQLNEPTSGEATLAASPSDVPETTRYLLLCPESLIPAARLHDLLSGHPPFSAPFPPPLRLRTVTVPSLAPTSAAQAADWSARFWPISYKNTNPYGPHPALVARAQTELAPRAGAFLALAERAAAEGAASAGGPAFGCAVVDAAAGAGEERVLAVAADARFYGEAGGLRGEGGGDCRGGNVLAHAVMRAIGMVAQKRLRAARRGAGANATVADAQSVPLNPVFADGPVHDIEKRFYDLDNVEPGGYLCAELDMYITHEPCVMCSMAMLHSRFRRCVFGKRMPSTGGLTADSVGGQKGLEQGIFWRRDELNWKFLTWEWVEDDLSRTQEREDPLDTLSV